VDSEAFIKETQSDTVSLCNHNESQVLSTTNDTIPSPPNNSSGEILPLKSIIDVLKAMEY